MQDFRRLGVWTKAHDLALDVHTTFGKIRKPDHGGIKSQAMRAAMSIPTNIAEGCGRTTRADLARFADIAVGSATELEYRLLIARDTSLIVESDYARLTDKVVEVRKMLFGLAKALRGSKRESPTGAAVA